ncbi:related to 5^ nucleotidase [Cephalotrichum gorgonifer]|uniref:Related to 5^ nucleotidase n=1 Tax=Cephalotrichum gorgonifer TaxID=2041049 RepID=A0AAE8MV37_9PEZI|nr:related to 5^ nucleotidase [Cephalotrichum gorgonifer]
MLQRFGTLLGAVAGIALVRAEQPGAARPEKAEIRDLTWGQLNFLHTTDTHGWHGGHLQEPQYSADWGDYVSFAHHMRKRADERGADLILIDTGDRVEGNGLYDASDPKGLFTYDIIKNQEIDLICSGNHELYVSETTALEFKRNIPNFQGRYIASNLDYIDDAGEQVPLAQRYRRFKTKNQGIDIMAFGFLFNFAGNANNSVVIPVQQAVAEEWFQKAIREDVDVFIVIGHVGLRMEEQKIIHKAIRKANWNSPILFFAGHAHVRDAVNFDSQAFGMASGRYFETIGWMSVDNIKKREKKAGEQDLLAISSKPTFTRRYIDNNLFGLYHHSATDAESFPTKKGNEVSQQITRARKVLDLDHKVGCAPKDLWLTQAPHDREDSIFSWLKDEVLPDVATKEDRADVPRLVIFNTGGIRFDIFKGAFTRDSAFLVSPFVSTLQYVPDVPYEIARKVITLLNSGGHIFTADGGLDARYMALPQKWSGKDLDRLPYHMPGPRIGPFVADDSQLQHRLGTDEGDEGDKTPAPSKGYTTEDDFGKDGDDTVHTPVAYYSVPNCIQSKVGFPPAKDGGEGEGEPETVDLVFIEFLAPWILVALKFAGGDYKAADILSYRNETATELLTGWIEENWKGDC